MMKPEPRIGGLFKLKRPDPGKRYYSLRAESTVTRDSILLLLTKESTEEQIFGSTKYCFLDPACKKLTLITDDFEYWFETL